jgi:hypothetical protein
VNQPREADDGWEFYAEPVTEADLICMKPSHAALHAEVERLRHTLGQIASMHQTGTNCTTSYGSIADAAGLARAALAALPDAASLDVCPRCKGDGRAGQRLRGGLRPREPEEARPGRVRGARQVQVGVSDGRWQGGVRGAVSVYVYAWGNNPRRAELKGRECVVEARGGMRSTLVRFVDNGERVITSARALRPVAQDGQ